MQLALIDWILIVGYFVVALGIGAFFSRRASKSLADYFVSGRSLPWWIAGTSMVATTFAADTPLAVTGLTAKHGLAGNWFWWAYAFGGMLTVFVFARLWRRSEVITDAELVELRYGGKPASILRGFRAVYFALPINCIVMGWVIKAMLTILNETVLYTGEGSEPFISDWALIAICLGVVAVYSTLSGLWGVAITDFFQFIIAMGGCIALAILAINDAGGVDQLRQSVEAAMPGGDAFNFIPDLGTASVMPIQMFLIYLFVIWWASWYPGAEPGGGGYVVQRMASCKDERHSLLATLWFQVAHYCVRPWPWLIVAFAAIAKYPELLASEDPGVGFPRLMRDLLPAGLRGLLLVAFFAAFMSTLSTQVNWGASYLVSDFYNRFIKPDATNSQLAWASRAATIIVLVSGGVFGFLMRDISVDDAWKLLAALGAGTGSVYMLRWFWWRVNAWSEISAMVASLFYFAAIKYGVLSKGEAPSEALAFLESSEYQLAVVAFLTIPTWIAVTYLTQPESRETLETFFRKARPGGPGWGRVSRDLPDVHADRNVLLSVLCAVFGAGLVFSTLIGIGQLIFGSALAGGLLLLLGGGFLAGIVAVMKYQGWSAVTE